MANITENVENAIPQTDIISNITNKAQSNSITKGFNSFRSQLADIEQDCHKAKIQVGDTELCDTNLFAFLNDWIKDLSAGDKKGHLKDMLKENDALSKEFLLKSLHSELDINQKLSNKDLDTKGIKDIDSLTKQLGKANIVSFAIQLVTDKITSFLQNGENEKDLQINLNDINKAFDKSNIASKAMDTIADIIPQAKTIKTTLKLAK